MGKVSPHLSHYIFFIVLLDPLPPPTTFSRQTYDITLDPLGALSGLPSHVPICVCVVGFNYSRVIASISHSTVKGPSFYRRCRYDYKHHKINQSNSTEAPRRRWWVSTAKTRWGAPIHASVRLLGMVIWFTVSTLNVLINTTSLMQFVRGGQIPVGVSVDRGRINLQAGNEKDPPCHKVLTRNQFLCRNLTPGHHNLITP